MVEGVVSIHDHGSHLEGEDQLMSFENTHANELIEELSQLFDDEA